jgi:TonB family protein
MLLILFACASMWAQSSSAPAQVDRPQFKLAPVQVSNAIYPAEALDQKIEGVVTVFFAVSVAGDVSGTQVFKADPLLAKAAKDAVGNWKFEPVLKDGKPIVVSSKASFHFAFGDENQKASGVVPEIGPAGEMPQRVRVSEGVSRNLLLSRTDPVYPPAAKNAHIQGTVVLSGVFDREGKVSSVTPVSGPPELIPAAIDCVRQWHEKPYLLMGEPVEVETTVQVNFTLSRR